MRASTLDTELDSEPIECRPVIDPWNRDENVFRDFYRRLEPHKGALDPFVMEVILLALIPIGTSLSPWKFL